MKLSRKTPSRKIQEKILGEHLEYASNLCSQFWMTVFAISCVTVFLPITLVVFGIGALVEGVSSYRDNRRRRLQDLGRKLTVEQAFGLALSLGIVHYTKDGIKFSGYEFDDLSSSSNKKKELLLYGWQRENWQNYDSETPAGGRLILAYIKKIESRTAVTTSIKKVAAGARTIVMSHVPIIYWTTTLAGFVFIIVMAIGAGWSVGDASTAAFFGFILGAFWLVPLVFMYCGGEHSNGWINGLVEKYGEPLKDDIFISYLKAVKHKMCPLIEWTD